MKSVQMDLSGTRVLVTGGTGFIGGRLVERLVLDCNAEVRVLVRDFARAARIARFAIEMVPGDVADPNDVQRAVGGCEIVFHCAYGNSGAYELRRVVNVQGTRNVVEAALNARVRRVVHVSTLMVYGATPDGDLDETAPRRYFGNNYSDSKLDAENVASEYAKVHGLPLTVLQPTAVYGPFGPVWTVNVLNKLKTGKVILVNGGDGLCNAVHIDDLVSAMLLAGTRDDAVGEAFLISGEQPITWRDFYARHERMLGFSSTVKMSPAEIKAGYIQNKPKAKSLFKEAWGIVREDPKIRERLSRTREVDAVKKAVRLFLPKLAQQLLKQQISTQKRTEQPPANVRDEKPVHPLSPLEVKFAAAKTRVRIDKAKRILGYQPIFDFESGMNLTEEWARWANLL